ncbi:MAG TPA: ribonuclease PH, partial [Actinobacteria bacterium]|nr:ribonuclease PH [Actinomycetota bacterium]
LLDELLALAGQGCATLAGLQSQALALPLPSRS